MSQRNEGPPERGSENGPESTFGGSIIRCRLKTLSSVLSKHIPDITIMRYLMLFGALVR